MTFQQEWAEIKGETATRLRLASSEGEGGDGQLRQSKRAWSQASAGIREVAGDLRSAFGGLSAGQDGAGGGEASVVGLLSATVQRSVYESWKRKVELLQRECGDVQGKMSKAAQLYYQTDHAIKDAFTGRPPAEGEQAGVGRPTPGEGGQSRW